MALSPLLQRWYAFLPLLACLGVLGWRHGWARAGAYAVLGWALTFAAEWGSSSGPGFPFGRYLYRAAALRHDWRVAGVPVFDSASFLWLAWCGLTLTGALGARGWRRWLTAALLMVGLDVGVDPVALRGRHWWLGQIYRYPGGGSWYGVPWSNYAGWALVALALVALAAICTGGPARPGARWAGALAAVLVAGVLGQSVALGLRLGIAPSGLASAAVVLLALALARAARPATDAGPPPELIVACALAREGAAVRRSGGWRAVPAPAGLAGAWRRGPVALWVTGMGPAAARHAAAGCPPGAAVLVAGVAGACRGGWGPGEV
ncbi:MAG TPA: carotenoid biosynthesis protein, partial [Candidatus Dormibacteraeota bacterium]|nr:carotenoid biosynthesis protein [Candidatus Dormibacteraeota bacterium]